MGGHVNAVWFDAFYALLAERAGLANQTDLRSLAEELDAGFFGGWFGRASRALPCARGEASWFGDA